MSNRSSRWGLRLFWVYAAAYLGFVGWNVLAPASMEQTVGGISLAVLSGLAVIGLAVLLALLYGVLCRGMCPAAREPREPSAETAPR